VFTKRKIESVKLSGMRLHGVRSAAINGDFSQARPLLRLTATYHRGKYLQAQRERSLSDFRRNTVNCLVATDVAARGLDIDDVTAVVHYELPLTQESFVHRSGRTGRAGRDGRVAVIVNPRQLGLLAELEAALGCTIAVRPAPPDEDGTRRSALTGQRGAVTVRLDPRTHAAAFKAATGRPAPAPAAAASDRHRDRAALAVAIDSLVQAAGLTGVRPADVVFTDDGCAGRWCCCWCCSSP
jgi:superfamily II DNA/RNA helicase